jgi:site-specific recombinase XerD
MTSKSKFPWFVDEFFLYKNLSINSNKIYKSEYKNFFNWLSEKSLCNKNLSQITLEELDKLTLNNIESYKSYLEKYTHSSTGDKFYNQCTINRKLSVLSSLFHYLANVAEYSYDKPYLQKNLFSYISRNYTKTPPYIKAIDLKSEILLTDDEIIEFRQFIKNNYYKNLSSERAIMSFNKNKLRDIAIISLFLFSGIRLNELANLNINNLFLSEQFIIVKSEKGIERKINIFESAAIHDLEKYLNERTETDLDHSYVFFTKFNGKYSKMSVRRIQDLIAKYSSSFFKSNLSARSLRHSFATGLLRKSNDIAVLKKELGQEKINPVWVYTNHGNKGNKIF